MCQNLMGLSCGIWQGLAMACTVCSFNWKKEVSRSAVRMLQQGSVQDHPGDPLMSPLQDGLQELPGDEVL